MALALGCSSVVLTPFGMVKATDLPLLWLTALAIYALSSASVQSVAALARWRLSLPLGLWLAWALVAGLVSGRALASVYGTPGSMLGWITLAATGVVLLVTASIAPSAREALLRVAPFVVLAEAAFGLFQKYVIGVWMQGTLSNPTYFAEVMVLFIPLLVLPLGGERLTWRRLRYSAIAAGVIAMGLSGARVGLAAVFVWLFATLLTGSLVPGLSVARRRIAAVVLVVVAVPAAVYTYRTGGMGLKATAVDRFARLQASWGALLDRPVFGWGPDGFVEGAARHVPKVLYASNSSEFGQFGADPHNLIAYVAVSTGVVGLALFAWLAVEVVRNWRLQSGVTAGLSAFIWAVALYTVQALFAPAALQTVALAAVVLGASLAVETRAAEESRQLNPAALTWAKWAAVGLLAVFVAYAGTRVIFGMQRIESADPRSAQAIANVWNDPFMHYRSSLVWGYAGQRDPEFAAGQPDLAAARKAIAVSPLNAVYRVELARTLAYHQAPRPQVEAAFREALEVYPGSPDAHAAWAEYLLSQGDTKAAWAKLKPVQGVGSREVWRVLGDYYEVIGQAERSGYYRALYARPRFDDSM